MQIKNILLTIKEYLLITVGILMFVLGWVIFLVPNNLVGGGVTGIASIIQYASGGAIKMGTSYFVINAGLVVAAIFILGKSFGVKTVYAIIVASAGLNLGQTMIPSEIFQTLAVDNGKLMSTIMGGIMVGVGIGISMSQGGSTGGTDIIALIVNKYRNVSPGRMILAIDVIIVTSSLLVPSITPTGEKVAWAEKIVTMVYGLMLIAVTSAVLDMYLSGSKQSVQVMILSKKYTEIADMVIHQMNRGATVLDGRGWYTKQPMEVVMVLTRKTDLNELLRNVKAIDPDAFMSVSLVTGVYGKGFESIKISAKKNKQIRQTVENQ